MDQSNTKIQELIKVLEANQTPAAETAAVLESMGNAVSARLFGLIDESLSDEEVARVDACPTDEEAEKMMKELFASKSPKTLEVLASELTDTFVTSFLEQYQKDKAAALANPVPTSN